jgi:hypothetical protein
LSRLGNRSLYELENGWVAGTRVRDRPHGSRPPRDLRPTNW